MGKNIKSYATFPQSISPREREVSLTAKSPNLSANNMVRLNRTHSFLKLQAKFSNLRSVFWQKFPANYANPVQFAHILRE